MKSPCQSQSVDLAVVLHLLPFFSILHSRWEAVVVACRGGAPCTLKTTSLIYNHYGKMYKLIHPEEKNLHFKFSIITPPKPEQISVKFPTGWNEFNKGKNNGDFDVIGWLESVATKVRKESVFWIFFPVPLFNHYCCGTYQWATGIEPSTFCLEQLAKPK